MGNQNGLKHSVKEKGINNYLNRSSRVVKIVVCWMMPTSPMMMMMMKTKTKRVLSRTKKKPMMIQSGLPSKRQEKRLMGMYSRDCSMIVTWYTLLKK